MNLRSLSQPSQQIRRRSIREKLKQKMTAVQRHLDRLRHHQGDKVDEAIKRIRSVPKWIRDCVVLAILSRLITYAAVFLERINKGLANKTVNPYLCPWYDNPMKLKWYIKFASDPIAWVLISWMICKITMRVSDYLFLVSVIFLGYHLLDTIMFFWNFERYELIYWDMILTAVILTWSIFKRYQPETIAKIKSLF